jgi:CP family cyanate transporter-like MFS transporter
LSVKGGQKKHNHFSGANMHSPNRSRSAAVLLTGFVLLSLNTRVPFGQVGPIAPLAGFSSGLVMLLGALPPLGMGIAAPFVPLILRRAGEDHLLLWASILALAGAAVRSFGLSGLIVGTCVVSLAIGVINVLVPVYVRRRFVGTRVGPVFGAYALSMGLGSALAAFVAVPMAETTGRWELSIATATITAVLAVVGGIMMLDTCQATGQTTPSTPTQTAGSTTNNLARSWLAWSLLCFFGVQTLLFYALLAWLPSIIIDSGGSTSESGLAQTLLILGIATGGLFAPIAGARHSSQTSVVATIIASCTIGLLGIALLPTLSLSVWVPLLGLGLGGGQALPAVLYSHRGKNHRHTAALSAFAQTGGFLVAALGPVLLNAARELAGSWTVPLIALGTVCAANLFLSWHGARTPEKSAVDRGSSTHT